MSMNKYDNTAIDLSETCFGDYVNEYSFEEAAASGLLMNVTSWVATLKLPVADGLFVSARLIHHFCSSMKRGEEPSMLGKPVLCDIRRLTVDYV